MRSPKMGFRPAGAVSKAAPLLVPGPRGKIDLSGDAARRQKEMQANRPQTTQIPLQPVRDPEALAREQATQEGYGACLPPQGDDKILCYRTDCADSRRAGEWKLLEFDVCISAAGRAEDGTAICVDQQFIKRVRHWADLQAADAQAEEAWRLVQQEARVRALDDMRFLPRADLGLSPQDQQRVTQRYEAQVDYLREIFQAIADFYNNLNIPWSMDPEARRLYRKYLAGSSDVSAEFQKDSNYNDGNWYGKKDIDPNTTNYPLITQPAGPQQGILTRKARELHKVFDPGVSGTHFRQRAGVRIEASGADWRDPMKDPYIYGQAPRNVGFASPIALGGRGGPFGTERQIMQPKEGSPVTATNYSTQKSQWEPTDRFRREDARLRGDDQIQDGRYIADWRSFSWTGYVGAPNQQAGAPLRDYLEWAREWAYAIATRGAARTLRDSREYVMKTNAKWVRSLGGPEQFVETIAGRDERLKQELKGTGGEVANAIVGGIADTVGSIFGGMTGGVVNLVTGGVKAISSVITSLINTGEIRSFGRDDLGRWKPSLERATLRGDVNDPEQPPDSLPVVPAWFCRNPNLNPQQEMDRRTPVVSGPVARDIFEGPPPGLSRNAKIAIAFVGAGALVFAGAGVYKYWQRSKVPTRRTVK